MKIMLISMDLISNVSTTRLQILEPKFNSPDVLIHYTKNNSDPLLDGFVTKNYIPVHSSCTLQLIGAKIDNTISPLYTYEINYSNKSDKFVCHQIKKEEYIFDESYKTEVFDNTALIQLDDNSVVRSRYYPTDPSIDLDRCTYLRVTSAYRNRLDKIAYDFYNNPEYWWVIAESNRDVIIDPLNVPVGTNLILPDITDVSFRGQLARNLERSDFKL